MSQHTNSKILWIHDYFVSKWKKRSLLNNNFSFRVRGSLNSLLDPFNNSGIIISFILGNFLSCMDQAKIHIIPSILFLVILFFLPESPEFWTNRNKINVKCWKLFKIVSSYWISNFKLQISILESFEITSILQRQCNRYKSTR